MKSFTSFSIVVVFLALTMFSSNIFAQKEIASIEVGDAITMQFYVCGVFASDRSLWVYKPGEPENVQSFYISEEAHNFDQIKVGDLITTTYYETVVLSLNEPGEVPEEKDETVLVRAAKGEMPGGVAVEVHEVSAIVQSYDEETGIATLMGPKGNTMKYLVSEEVWEAGIVKVGEVVHARYTQTLAISVERVE